MLPNWTHSELPACIFRSQRTKLATSSCSCCQLKLRAVSATMSRVSQTLPPVPSTVKWTCLLAVPLSAGGDRFCCRDMLTWFFFFCISCHMQHVTAFLPLRIIFSVCSRKSIQRWRAASALYSPLPVSHLPLKIGHPRRSSHPQWTPSLKVWRELWVASLMLELVELYREQKKRFQLILFIYSAHGH